MSKDYSVRTRVTVTVDLRSYNDDSALPSSVTSIEEVSCDNTFAIEPTSKFPVAFLLKESVRRNAERVASTVDFKEVEKRLFDAMRKDSEKPGENAAVEDFSSVGKNS